MKFKTTKEEFEANEFAMEILMPEHEFKNVFSVFKIDGMKAIAEHFGVSEMVAIQRAKALKLLEDDNPYNSFY